MTHRSSTEAAPTLRDRIVPGTVVLRSGALRDAYRLDGTTYFLPVSARPKYRRAPKTLALTFKAN